MATDKDAFLLAHDVAKLLVKKSMHHRLKVSIKGTVTSLSRIVKVNSDSLFMMEVDSCVPILVKDFQLEWHSLLEPGGMYLFHSLIMTTIEKGVLEPQAVMLAWNDSCLTEIGSDSDVVSVSLDRWLMSHGVLLDLPDSTNIGESCRQDQNCDNCVNYEGQVTSTQDAKDGFYTLDDKMRLYCNDVDIAVNCELYIFNAHLIEHDSTPYLVCCERSLLREKKSSDKAPAPNNGSENSDQISDLFSKAKGKRASVGLAAIFQKRHLTLREMLAAIKIRDLIIKLKRSSETASRAVKQLLCEKSLWEVPKQCKRFLEKFIHHDFNCAHIKQNTMMNRIPEILSLPSLKLEPCTEQNEHLQRIDTASSENNFSANCQYFKRCDHGMLVGTIAADSRGQIYFSDGTVNLPLLILEKPDNQLNTQEILKDCSTLENTSSACAKSKDFPTALHLAHFCTSICVNCKKSGEYLPCSFLDSSLVNKVILVREFHIVTEHYWNHFDKTVENKLIYLAFCLQNCVLVDEVDYKLCSGHDEHFICHIFVEKKLQLHAKNLSDILEFEIVGHILKAEENSENVQSDPLKSKGLPHENLVNWNERIKKASRNLARPEDLSRSCKDVKKRGTAQSFHNWTHSVSVSIIFSGTASNWYHFVHVGNLYLLETAQDPLVPNFSNGHLQKAAQLCCVRKKLRVTEVVRLERLVGSVPVMDKKPPEYSIRDILSEGFTDSVVSFQCQVQNRYTSNSAFADRCKQTAFIMVNTCLQVRELSCDQATDAALLSVYIDSPRNAYSFGLVPGAVIRFTCLERRVSQAENVYCRFTAASSLQVLNLHPLEQFTRPLNRGRVFKTPVLSELPKALLTDLWLLGPDNSIETSCGALLPTRQRLYALECHICMFFQLMIKTVCSLCREIFVDGKCQSKRCRDDGHPVLVVKAVVLVDDGSGQATVTLHNTSLVARMLTLTEEQWNDISVGLSDCGELFITKDGTVSPLPIAQLLSSLCSSSLVLRPCKLAVARDKKSPCQHLVDKKTLDEFQIRELKIAKNSVHAWSLPLLSLECFAMEDIG